MRKTSWRPHYAASTWQAVWAQMHATMADRAKKRAVKAPPITNAEAVAFIRVWRGATASDSAIWYQLAAVAYGWDPQKRDELRVDAKQADAKYSMPDAVWNWSKGIAEELDARKLEVPASLAPNRATFGDPVFYAEVRAKLLEDGASPSIETKRPVVRAESRGSGFGWVAIVAIAAMVLSDKRRSAGRKGRRR
jgi:hypothetical protein